MKFALRTLRLSVVSRIQMQRVLQHFDPIFQYLTMNEGIIQSIFIRHPFGVCGFANGQKFGVSVYAGCRAVNAAVVYYNYVVMLSDGGAVLV